MTAPTNKHPVDQWHDMRGKMLTQPPKPTDRIVYVDGEWITLDEWLERAEEDKP